MRKVLSAFLILCLLLPRAFVPMAWATENPFDDVPSGAHYYDAVMWAVENKITAGTSATEFSPGASCTRAQMVTFLWRASGSPEPEASECPFVDVPNGAYYTMAVVWAAENKITAGTSATEFSPGATVTRGQTVTFLYRYAKGTAPQIDCPFEDVSDTSYWYLPVLWAYQNGVTAGNSATEFAPMQPCTRAQIVTFLWRLSTVENDPDPTEPTEPTEPGGGCIGGLEHDYVLTSETPATCIQLATKTETCSRCGDVRTTEYGDYGPHSPVTVVVTEPTETTPGLERDICEVCHTILAEREIPATGTPAHTHTWVKFLVESDMDHNTNFPFVFPTGENGGSLAVQYGDWYVYYCSECKHLYYDYYMTEPNHVYTSSGMIRCDYRKTNDEAEIEMQSLVNDLRQANGKSRLMIDPICQAIARRRAVETYWNNSHSGRDPRTCENIGGGPNVVHDFTGLCNSSGHRATMLYSYLEYMGYGIYYTGFLPCFGSVQVFSDWVSLYDE